MTPEQRQRLPKYAQAYIEALEEENAVRGDLLEKQPIFSDRKALPFKDAVAVREGNFQFKRYPLESFLAEFPGIRVEWEHGKLSIMAYEGFKGLRVLPWCSNIVKIETGD